MTGETNLSKLIKRMSPVLNEGEYVFASTLDTSMLNRDDIICEFREQEGITVVVNREYADSYGLSYDFIASWITLQVHSSLKAVGLTAAFSQALAEENISCNVIAGYYHDHIFIAKGNEDKAMEVIKELSTK